MSHRIQVGMLGPQVGKTRLRLDWKEYFHNFVEQHGEPVPYGDNLLFRDGWQYSKLHYQGPEYPPPDDKKELGILQLIYWHYLHRKLSEELGVLVGQIHCFTDWQNKRSLPLQRKVFYETGGEDGVPLHQCSKIENLDLSGLKRNLADIEYLRDEAQEHLDSLR